MAMARRRRWLMESKAGGAGYRKGFAPVAAGTANRVTPEARGKACGGFLFLAKAQKKGKIHQEIDDDPADTNISMTESGVVAPFSARV